jgi:hypothetical protein
MSARPGGHALWFALVASVLLAGCETYPPAEAVAACAAARFGTENGTFRVHKLSGSSLFSTEYAIIYARRQPPDRASVIYNRARGPVTTDQVISFGNHAEIKGAVEAIRDCAQPESQAAAEPAP